MKRKENNQSNSDFSVMIIILGVDKKLSNPNLFCVCVLGCGLGGGVEVNKKLKRILLIYKIFCKLTRA